ncbi:hypothetical protein [Inquilinus sp. CA228]|uniref:hypothetical protein n=1 Tax=Inquilinus sp. CA228 TaxID=3455609 RepID=UPI003F8D0F88
MAMVTKSARQLFRYKIADCDVSDRGRLAEFRQKLEQWDELLNGDEAHAISGQFSDMLWQDAAWRSANEARRFAQADGPNASVAPLLAAMLDRGYVAGQVIAISRLLEWSNPKHPKKGVISLRRVVDEMRLARDLITRENFVAQDALPYDWEAAQTVEITKMVADANESGGVTSTWMDTTGPNAWDAAKRQHELFDKISGVTPATRDRSDLIEIAFFDRLDAFLGDQVFEDILALRNKSIAHAADSFSRAQAAGLRAGMKLDEYAKAHYLLFSVYHGLSVVLLGQWRGAAVPIPQYDQFAHLEDPFIAAKRLPDLQAFWEAHNDEREGWIDKAYRAVVPDRPF